VKWLNLNAAYPLQRRSTGLRGEVPTETARILEKPSLQKLTEGARLSVKVIFVRTFQSLALDGCHLDGFSTLETDSNPGSTLLIFWRARK
jgi:hypothetical protein